MGSAVSRMRPAIALLVLIAVSGCLRPPTIIPAHLRRPIDRSIVEFPAGMQFERYISALTAPTAIEFDKEKNALLIAESGIGGAGPRIIGFNYVDGTPFTVYPQGKVLGPFRENPFRIYGPIGGMAVRDGVIYVSHRDKDGVGVISAVTYDGKGKTVVGGLPAQGDYGVTDIVFDRDGRMYFGVGSATNSGVVGLDNFKRGWVQKHPRTADKPYIPIRLLGSRMFSNNPNAGLFTGSELAITAPFHPFGEYSRSRIIPKDGDKPNAAIFSVMPTGGIANDIVVEAHGIRMPAGLAFNSNDQLFTTNQGMELRGSRPVWNDPNTVLRIYRGRWYGWPDFSANLLPITNSRFKEKDDVFKGTGYDELNTLLEHPSDLNVPFDQTDRENMVRAEFPSLSGAAGMTFLPDEGPLNEFRRELIVALSGDRAPFANSGRKLRQRVGFQVVRVDTERATVNAFIRNTAGVPRSLGGGNLDMLERPMDVAVGPDGYLYVLDFGQLEVRNGKDKIKPRTGQVFRMLPANVPSTGPSMPDPSTQN
jgi:glucose/arabinose dehydrogenase